MDNNWFDIVETLEFKYVFMESVMIWIFLSLMKHGCANKVNNIFSCV